MGMRQEARAIRAAVEKLLDEMRRLQERSGDLRRHFRQAQKDVEPIDITADAARPRT